MNLFKKSLAVLSLGLASVVPRAGFCGIWDLTLGAIAQSKAKISYDQVISHLHLLTTDDNIIRDADHEGTFIIAGGYIVVSPDSIRSFQNPGDHTRSVAPEFEFIFERSQSDSVEEAKISSVARTGLEKLRISIDVIPSHPLFKNVIGSWSYEKFVGELQIALGKSLSSLGAKVSHLRPEIQLNASNFDEINKNPPQIVISTQFNNDKQDCMTTFCGGNILKSEFTSDRQRARFVEAALTGKHIYSSGLGACITKHCQVKLKVQPLAWERASFEGNARPVPVSNIIRSDADLEERNGNFDGISMRNLIHNGLFAKAVVIPFPDMQWVRNQVKAGHESEWIAEYAETITEAVMDYVGKHPAAFE